LDFYFAYGKIEHDKSHGHIKTMKNLFHQSKIFLWAKKSLILLLSFFTFTILGNQFGASDVFAAPTPTLSAAINNASVTINGNQVINSANKTTEFPLRLTVNTNNRTGYTATISSESNNTSLVNNSSALQAKIDSISTPSPLANLPNNTWGYRLASAPNYNPIPALAAPASFRQTTEATNGVSVTDLNIGMKLTSNLENGSYANRLIFSVVTNPIDRRAVFKPGPEINQAIARVNYSRANAFRRCSVTDAIKRQSHYNVADPVESDFDVYIWPDWSWGDQSICYGSDAAKIYANPDSSFMFSSFSGIYSADLSGIDTSEVISMKGMFKGASTLSSLDLSRFDTRKVQDMSEMFSEMAPGRGGFNFALDLSSFNTQNVTNMKGMFRGSTKFTGLNMPNFNTSNVTDMSEMFSRASRLTSLNLSSFDFQNVRDMNNMFSYTQIASLVVSRFNTGNVLNFSHLFDNTPLTSINTTAFETQSATNMSSMFAGVKLTTLDLSSFNTQNVTDMSYMFAGTEYLTTLYLTNFDTRNVTKFNEMFYLGRYTRDSLTRIYAKNDFNLSSTPNLRLEAFGGRRLIKTSNGSSCYIPTGEQLKCLRIDRPGAPGYFTQI
jgi:hypothetical protein